MVCFEKGFLFLKLDVVVFVEKGIMVFVENEMKNYLEVWDIYKEGEKIIVKFVFVFGVVSCMFKNLFEFLGVDYNILKIDFEKKFFDYIYSFVFYNDLNVVCMDNIGKDIDVLMVGKEYKFIVVNLLEVVGLNYGVLLKGLLKFYWYVDGVCILLEEYLVEGVLYVVGKIGKVNVYFIVFMEYCELFIKLVEEKVVVYVKKYGVEYDVLFFE